MSWLQKRLLPERDETYQQFLKLFSDYVGGKSLEQMKSEMKELFKDDRDLIEGFEDFLPATNLKKEGDESVEEDNATI
jgi:histone deacetylase complex regulatory component SIN3